jgi:hypothetical protein
MKGSRGRFGSAEVCLAPSLERCVHTSLRHLIPAPFLSDSCDQTLKHHNLTLLHPPQISNCALLSLSTTHHPLHSLLFAWLCATLLLCLHSLPLVFFSLVPLCIPATTRGTSNYMRLGPPPLAQYCFLFLMVLLPDWP